MKRTITEWSNIRQFIMWIRYRKTWKNIDNFIYLLNLQVHSSYPFWFWLEFNSVFMNCNLNQCRINKKHNKTSIHQKLLVWLTKLNNKILSLILIVHIWSSYSYYFYRNWFRIKTEDKIQSKLSNMNGKFSVICACE